MDREVILEPRWLPQLLKFNEVADEHFGIRNETVKPISSYSWLKRNQTSSQPTILVPGCPRVWTRKEYPFQVSSDNSNDYGDSNIQEFPQSPMHPLFVSVGLIQPEFSFPSMDLITDKTVLRNLLRWVQGKGTRDFSVEAEILGDKTLVLFSPNADVIYGSGLHRKTVEMAHSSISKGWEHAFGHYRVITYKFGDLDLLVRFPVDIIDPQGWNNPLTSLALPEGKDIQSLWPLSTSSQGLGYIRHDGQLVYQSAVTELTVRVASNSNNFVVDWEKSWHLCYFSMSPNLFTVTHMGGNVNGMKHDRMFRSTGSTSAVKNSKLDIKNVEFLVTQMLEHVKNIIEKCEANASVKLRFDLQVGQREIQIFRVFSPSNILLL